MARIVRELTAAGYPKDTPVAVVYRVGWPEEKVIRGALSNIAKKVREAKINLQALILVGPALDESLTKAQAPEDGAPATSHLYSRDYTHLYRKGRRRTAKSAAAPSGSASVAPAGD